MADQPAPLADRLREALAAEYAGSHVMTYGHERGWQVAMNEVERDMPFIRRALDRAGLVLAEREGRES